MNGNRLRYVTKDLLDSIWPPIDNSFKKVENPIPLDNPIVDKLLANYEIGNHKKTAIFSAIIERMSLPRVAVPADITTKTSESIHTAQMGTRGVVEAPTIVLSPVRFVLQGVGGKLRRMSDIWYL